MKATEQQIQAMDSLQRALAVKQRKDAALKRAAGRQLGKALMRMVRVGSIDLNHATIAALTATPRGGSPERDAVLSVLRGEGDA